MFYTAIGVDDEDYNKSIQTLHITHPKVYRPTDAVKRKKKKNYIALLNPSFALEFLKYVVGAEDSIDLTDRVWYCHG